MKKALALLAASLILSNSVYADQKQLEAAIKADNRSPAYSARDAYRNPLQTLSLFDVQPDHTVVEIWPGGGWYTEILAPYLPEEGLLIAAHYDSADTQASYRPNSRKRFEEKMAANKSAYGKVLVNSLTFDRATSSLKIPAAASGTADRVLTFRNAHH